MLWKRLWFFVPFPSAQVFEPHLSIAGDQNGHVFANFEMSCATFSLGYVNNEIVYEWKGKFFFYFLFFFNFIARTFLVLWIFTLMLIVCERVVISVRIFRTNCFFYCQLVMKLKKQDFLDGLWKPVDWFFYEELRTFLPGKSKVCLHTLPRASLPFYDTWNEWLCSG